MAERDTFIRSLHDLGMAAWFGGSLMGAVGVNGAAGAAKDPSERLRLSSIGWAKWTPVQVAAIGVHAVGGIGLMVSNKRRLGKQPGAASATAVKLVLTGLAAGVSGYSGYLGTKIAKHAVAERISVREAVVALGFVERGELTEAQLDEALDVLSMTAPSGSYRYSLREPTATSALSASAVSSAAPCLPITSAERRMPGRASAPDHSPSSTTSRSTETHCASRSGGMSAR